MREIGRAAPAHDERQNEAVRLRCRDGHELEIWQAFRAQSASGFTSTKVQILTGDGHELEIWQAFRAQSTSGFTSTKVQILTRRKALQAVLLVQKYKY
jgi:hypothetical protein